MYFTVPLYLLKYDKAYFCGQFESEIQLPFFFALAYEVVHLCDSGPQFQGAFANKWCFILIIQSSVQLQPSTGKDGY